MPVTSSVPIPAELAPVQVHFRERRKVAFLLALTGLIVVAGVVALLTGTYSVSPLEVIEVLQRNLLSSVDAGSPVHQTVVWEIRLPRILTAILVGFALAVSGAVYQGCFRNPLVEPFILGVSAGASLGASIGILYPGLLWNVQSAAFLFALVAVALVYGLSRVDGRNPTLNLILAGIIIASLFQAAVSILKYLSDDASLRAIVFWIMGGLYYANWSDVAVLAPLLGVGLLLFWASSWRLNVLSLGDVEARSLGVNPDRLRLLLIVVATLLTAVSVAAVGIIAWVGLMMPHAARLVLGPDHRFVIPAAGLMGGLYLLACDTLARTLIGTEIPISIVTSILGAPYLFYLLRRRGRLGMVETQS